MSTIGKLLDAARGFRLRGSARRDSETMAMNRGNGDRVGRGAAIVKFIVSNAS